MALKNARLIENSHMPLNELTSEEDRSFRLWVCNGGDSTFEMFQNASAVEAKQILNGVPINGKLFSFKRDPAFFTDAYDFMLDRIRNNYPEAKIV